MFFLLWLLFVAVFVLYSVGGPFHPIGSLVGVLSGFMWIFIFLRGDKVVAIGLLGVVLLVGLFRLSSGNVHPDTILFFVAAIVGFGLAAWIVALFRAWRRIKR
jgi:hypothetical protein